MAERRRWLHCTTTWRGETWTAGRHVPRYGDEPAVPRLCVGRSVAACFAARLFVRGPVFVYRTSERSGLRPLGVPDAVLTGERWIVPPVQLELVRRIEHKEVVAASRWLVALLREPGRACGPTALERMYAYGDAVRVLGAKESEKTFVREVITYLESRYEAT